MSFWDDEFYSTKDSTWNNSNRDRRRKKMIGVMLISLLLGTVCALVLLRLFSGGGYVDTEYASRKISAEELGKAKLDYNQLVVLAAETVNPSVVSIFSSISDKQRDMISDLGLGSGIIFQKIGGKARIITNNHVVQGANRFEVVLSTGEKKEANLIGKDVITDLAVLEVDALGVNSVALFGDSDQLKAGETAIAIGNPLGLGFSPTITVGVISSPRRTIQVPISEYGEWELDVIQTDAAINQGNSGGALVNLEGEVIGINSLKMADIGVEGLGFAIPINQVKPIIESLIVHGKVKRPYMGVYTQDLALLPDNEKEEVLKLSKEVNTGIVVTESVGPALEAGLQANDVIVGLDKEEIESTLSLRKYIYSKKDIGDGVEVTFYREGKKQKLTLQLGELKEKEE